eukprot:gene10446-2968_t
MSSPLLYQEQEIDQAVYTPIEVQEAKLKEIFDKLKSYTYYLQKALKEDNFKIAMKYCEEMLQELRISILLPKLYYKLYMAVFDELTHLDMFFREKLSKKQPILPYFELVQQSQRIVPRLYMTIMASATFIKSQERPAKEVLQDLLEMCKGVQHPTRSLFLRLFLLKMCRDKLPEKENEYIGKGGSLKDSIEFLISNFKEMVNLWVRLKSKDENEQRETERKDLSDIVGGSLDRISNLYGIDLELYKDIILPKCLEIILNTKDKLCQQYLMYCIIQTFPDEYHIQTLPLFCQTCLELSEGVDLRIIFVSLMQRLAKFVTENPQDVPQDINVVQIFSEYTSQILQKSNIVEYLSIQTALSHLSVSCFPKDLSSIEKILNDCSELSSKFDTSKATVAGKIIGLLKSTYDVSNLLDVLEMDGFLNIYNLLSFDDKKEISISILEKISQDQIYITSMEEINQLFEIIHPLTKSDDDDEEEEEEEENKLIDEEFISEQQLVTKILSLFRNEDPDELFKMYAIARKQFGQGGFKRVPYTLPPLIFSYLKLAEILKNSNGKFTDVKVFQYVVEIIKVLSQKESKMGFKLFLQTVLCANRCGNTTALYNCVSEAFILYEEAESKLQPKLLIELINTILIVDIESDHFETLSTKLCQYSAKLLRKSDQSKCGALCSILFFPKKSEVSTEKSLECLKWSLGIIKSCMENEQIPLFVEVLNIYLYHFNLKNDHLSADLINKIISIINDKISDYEEQNENLVDYFQNTIKKTILSEIDKTIGRNKPPAIEYIYVNPVQSFKFRFSKLFSSDSSQNPYGHACVKYTLKDGTQKLMNIVGLPTMKMVHFIDPKHYLFSDPNITQVDGSEQGGIYNRSFVGFRIEEYDEDLIKKMDEFFKELDNDNLNGKRGYTLLTSFSKLFGFSNATEKGNCSYWTSKGLSIANLFDSPTLWPKFIISKLYFSSSIQKDNFNIIYYKCNKNQQKGWIKPFQFVQDEIFKNLELFSNVKIEVDDENEIANCIKNDDPFRPFIK